MIKSIHIYGIYLAISICVLLQACKTESKSTTGYSSAILDGANRIETTYKVNPKRALPDPCQLISKETIATLFNVDPIYISPVDGSPDSNKKEHRACFFKWDDPDYPNTAILVQMQTNTMGEEYEEWMSMSVANKRTTGETMMGESEPHIFKIFPNVGSDGSYNYEIGKYYWRINNELMIMLAYNMEITEELQFNSAKTIAKEMMDNLSKHANP